MSYLKPSDVRFSQDSINNYFDAKCNHSHKMIGETLDDVCNYRCSVDGIPLIRVAYHDGNWVTADNRRLWVFRHLERLGMCQHIQVRRIHYILEDKLTSTNQGKRVRVRGNPGGVWYQKMPKPEQPSQATPIVHYQPSSVTTPSAQNIPSARTTSKRSCEPTVRPSHTVRYGSYGHVVYENPKDQGCCVIL